MAKSSIHEDIKQYRPGPCTEIKCISGHYYVYMYQAQRLPSGKWGKKTGKSIGTIIPGKGFIPNKNYPLYKGEAPQDELTVLEYGQYALIEAVAEDVLVSLKRFFPEDRAYQIFAYAVIIYANGFVQPYQVQSYYEQSWLSQEYKLYSFRMDKNALDTLLDDLGRRTACVSKFENAMIAGSSSSIAIDMHTIQSASDRVGSRRFRYPEEEPSHFLTGYDLSTGIPLFASIFHGAGDDSPIIRDTMSIRDFTGILFAVDKAFYSDENLKALSADNNTYIIPVPDNTDVYQEALRNTSCKDSFYYGSDKAYTRVAYAFRRISDTDYIYVFLDIDEYENSRFDYLHCMELGVPGYTLEEFEQSKEVFGIHILQSNASKTPKEIFSYYRKCRDAETFYQILECDSEHMPQDYCQEQGLAFITLITSQIHQKMLSAVNTLENSAASVHDILLMARRMKMGRRGDNWYLTNDRKLDLQILKSIGFEPKRTVPD